MRIFAGTKAIDMKFKFTLWLVLAAAALVSCANNKQVGVLTKPTSATTNVPGAEYLQLYMTKNVALALYLSNMSSILAVLAEGPGGCGP